MKKNSNILKQYLTKLLIFTKILSFAMQKLIYILIGICIVVACTKLEKAEEWQLRTPDGTPAQTVSVDAMNIRNPFIYLDKKTLTYYMTGDGGYLWISKDMHKWNGPYEILQLDSTMWMGGNPIIESPEIHLYKRKFYYVATFVRPDVVIENVNGQDIKRSSCQLFVADSIQGPYKPIQAEKPLLRADHATRNATFTTDEYGAGYIIYNHAWEQNNNETVQIIRLDDNFGQQIGEPYIMFKSSNIPLEKEERKPIAEGPFIFTTEEGMLGILFTTIINGEPCISVAYSQTGGLNGPWVIEPEPLLTGKYGQPVLFRDFDGSMVMLMHKDTVANGKKQSIPYFIEADMQFDKLKINNTYNF